jgi:hypothetical protein
MRVDRCPTRGGELDHHLTPIRNMARALDSARTLEPIDEPRDRTGSNRERF